MRKVVSAQRKAARRERGRELKVEMREEEKKKAICAERRENQTAMKDAALKAAAEAVTESRMYAIIMPRVRVAATGVPPRSRRKAAQGARAAAILAL